MIFGFLFSCASSPKFTSNESNNSATKTPKQSKARYSKDKDSKKENVDVRMYGIIYEAVDEVKKAMTPASVPKLAPSEAGGPAANAHA